MTATISIILRVDSHERNSNSCCWFTLGDNCMHKVVATVQFSNLNCCFHCRFLLFSSSFFLAQLSELLTTMILWSSCEILMVWCISSYMYIARIYVPDLSVVCIGIGCAALCALFVYKYVCWLTDAIFTWRRNNDMFFLQVY